MDDRRRPRGIGVECARLGHAAAAAVGMYDEQRSKAGALAQGILGFAQRPGEQRVHAGVEQRRRGTQAVLGPARHLVRERDGHAAEQMRRILHVENALHLALVRRLERRAAQCHHQRPRAPAEEKASRLHHLLGPRFRHDGAGRVDLFVDGGNEVRLDQRTGCRGKFLGQPAAGEKTKTGASALHQGIGGQRGTEANHLAATEQTAHVGKAHPLGALIEASDESDREVVRRRLHLGQPVALAIGEVAIGERAAGVDVRGGGKRRHGTPTVTCRPRAGQGARPSSKLAGLPPLVTPSDLGVAKAGRLRFVREERAQRLVVHLVVRASGQRREHQDGAR